MAEGLQEGLQRGENFVSDQRADFPEDRDNGLPRGHRRGIVEGYLSAEVELHLHLRVMLRDEFKDWCLVFECAKPGADEFAGLQVSDIKTIYLADPGDEGRETVLIQVVKVVKDGQELAVPSLVRLKALQGCVHPCWHPVLWADLVADPAVKSAGFGRNGELSRFLVGRGIGASDDNGQLVGEMVKSLPKVVGDITDKEWHSRIVRLLEDPDAADVLAGFDLALVNDQARFSLRPPLLGRTERIQMFERPVQLQSMA